MKLKLFTTILLLCTLFQSYAYKKQSIDITVNGQKRNMVVFTPNSLPDNSPLFIVTHGMNQDPEYQYGSDKMYEMIDTAKFVIAYLRSDGSTWDTGGTKDQNFVLKTIDEMAAKFSIDTNRVYWSGFSMGSMLIHHCIANMQDKIAAFAPTSGIQFSEQPWNNCKKPVVLLECIAYDDDVFGYEQYGIHDYIENYAKHDKHPTYKKTANYKPISSSWYNGDLERWTGGPNGGEVALYSYHNGGHWPMDLNRHLIWNFCKRYSLDPNIPNARIITPTVNDTYTYLDTIPVSFRVSDKDGTVKLAQLYLDGTMRQAYRDLNVRDTLLTYDWMNPKAGSHTIRIVVTDNDNKKKEVSRTITVENPVPIVMTEACYENNSFDIPLTVNAFRYAFDLKVEAENVVAYMSGSPGRVDFKAEETGLSNVITLKPIEGAEIQEGTYTMNITKVKDERGVTASNFKFVYTFGVSETSSAAIKYKKPFNEALNAAQALYDATADEHYTTAEKLRASLKEVLDTYASFASTSPTEYEAATAAIIAVTEPLAVRKQNLDDYFALYAEVDSIIALYADNPAVNENNHYTRLVKARDYYSTESHIKNDTQILNSIKQLTSYYEKFLKALETIDTGIYQIVNSKLSNDKYYDLQGHRLSSQPRKGIVIIDGHKYLVK
jgi:poly(3-hydroxybutyrate) depolymerase